MTVTRKAHHLRRIRRFKRTISFRVTKWDEVRIEKVLRKYGIPWGITWSSRLRALFRVLAAEEKKGGN